MKADLDETIVNLNEGLQVSKNSEVFSESRVQKPEVPAPTQADIAKLLFWPQQMQNKACITELSAHYWFEIEGNIDNLYSWFINYLFFWTRFLPIAAFHVLQQHVSPNDLWLFRLTWWQLQDWLEAFWQNHISNDLDFGSEPNLDRNDPTV